MDGQLLFMVLTIYAVVSADSKLENFTTNALPDKTTCGVVKDESRILGGEIVELGEFPWMVSIEYQSKLSRENKGALCAGTLISNRYVLTAATCIISREYYPVSVSLGEWKISTDPDCRELLANVECADPVKKLPINRAIPHPYYSRASGYNDIGLILLENEIQFTDYISPICLPFPNLPPPELGTHMSVAGWGATENGTASDVLLKVKLPLVSNHECKFVQRMPKIPLSSLQMCAGGEIGKDSCTGDSGAPLMRIYEDKQTEKIQWYQDGIVSQGLGCGRAHPAIYTRVSSYLNWIITIISEN